MATLLFFHAHPDDEAIATGGTMLRAAADGHRVILTVATHGEEGEVADGFLDDGEHLKDRRIAETRAAADILGASRVVFLGYRDSGMMGTDANDHPEAFWQADIEEAARRLAEILVAESVDVLTVYDSNGGYGHPDHIQVHRVGHRAADLAGTGRVYEATLNRDRIVEMREHARQEGLEAPERESDDEGELQVGIPDAHITTIVSIDEFVPQKRAAMSAHASQIPDDSWFMQLPAEVFGTAFGREWFVRTTPPFAGTIPEDREQWLLP
ncbi:MAG TPA: PIG-L family deacetylase [Acidimicrobiia bacterium]|nr:PIG-L family deacetylase [Acidimicrobiia bacterium]